jgi:hypothetical protein
MMSEAGAVVPDARVVEGPEEGSDVDDDDEADEHAAEELELGVDAACLDVVFGVEVVAPEHDGLQDIDAADGEPAEGGDHRHDEALADVVFELVGEAGYGGEDEEEAGEEEDCAGGFAEIALEAPAEAFALLLFAAQQTEQDVVDYVCEHDGCAEQEDDEEPGVTEVRKLQREQIQMRGREAGRAERELVQGCSVCFAV